MSSSRFTHFARVLATGLAILFAGTLLSSPVMAGKPEPGSCSGKYKNDPGCGGGSDPTLPPANSTSVLFQDTITTPAADVGGGASSNCEMSADSTATTGRYNCLSVGDMWLSNYITMIFNNKYRKICNSLGGSPFAVEVLSFGWSDACASDGSCAVDATVHPTSASVVSATGGVADSVDLVFSGTLNVPVGGDPNPFSAARSVQISAVDMVFFSGTRIVGVCTGYPPNGNVFQSTPN